MGSQNDSMPDLPHLAGIFEALRRGKHISLRDGEIFHDLKRQEESYGALFTKLGFRMMHHPRDFFYFFDTSNFTDLSARMSVFMFILVEDLADRGEAVEDAVITRRFSYKDLPHLEGERRRATMREAGVTTQEDLVGIVRTMERFGFARRLDEEGFSFETPVYRFLDLCMDMAEQADASEAHAADTGGSEEDVS